MEDMDVKTEQENIQLRLKLSFEALDSCSGYVDNINSNISGVVSFYQENKIEEAEKLFIDVVEVLDLFVQLTSQVHLIFKTDLPNCELPQDLIDVELHLLSVSKTLLTAKEKNDVIMLCDLLEYELVDNLNKWKETVIPQLQELKKER